MQTAPTNEKSLSAAECPASNSALQQKLERPAHLTPRHRRLLLALLDGPQNREEVDVIVGASNGPDEVMRVRKRFGLVIPCERKQGFDRDQHRVEFGLYSLTDADRVSAEKLLTAHLR